MEPRCGLVRVFVSPAPNKRTENGLIYPREVLRRAVEKYRINPDVLPRLKMRESEIELADTAHKISSVYFDRQGNLKACVQLCKGDDEDQEIAQHVSKYEFRLLGNGNVDDDGFVTTFYIMGIVAEKKE